MYVDSVFAKNYTYKLCTTVPYCDRRSTRIQTRPKCHRDCSSSRISTSSIVLNYLLVPSVNEEYRKCSTPLSCASTFPTTTDPSRRANRVRLANGPSTRSYRIKEAMRTPSLKSSGCPVIKRGYGTVRSHWLLRNNKYRRYITIDR